MRQLYALILGTGLCLPSMALAATPSDVGSQHVAKAPATQVITSVQAQPQAATAKKAASDTDRSRYAAKEAQSGTAKDYRGGDTVVIGATAATAILAVLLIVILI